MIRLSDPVANQLCRQQVNAPCIRPLWIGIAITLALVSWESRTNLAQDNTHRRTPLVQAVDGARGAVVNLRGRKQIIPASTSGSEDQARHVNGMGTGVVIDERGYVLTNYHVVEDVQQIQVTTADRQSTIATLVAHDPETDLALLKINTRSPLPVIRFGTSSDLMLAETVAAVGNAYGYDNTVTVGIVSHLNRTVQVNERQLYRNLIQTDASINPGNSGGPLLNLDGDMVGVNVAVRVGAQGIAFAIPVNDAVEVASRLMAKLVDAKLDHGLTVETVYPDHHPRVVVKHVVPGSPAAAAGLLPGDYLSELDNRPLLRSLDLYRFLLDRQPGDAVECTVQRGTGQASVCRLELGSKTATASQANQLAWRTMGLQVVPASESEMAGRHANYKQGLKVIRVRPQSPAEKEGIQAGDILVAMHGWKTESIENLAYILEQPELFQDKSFMFFILRGREPFFGQMRLSETK
ncbi:MAG TPA: trypsin-like peptidase domain-containing protein [Pirellulaceae bacterium]|nr:trypsin-like peptidase domain-containing protein [Pirellulaceae bacterium]